MLQEDTQKSLGPEREREREREMHRLRVWAQSEFGPSCTFFCTSWPWFVSKWFAIHHDQVSWRIICLRQFSPGLNEKVF